MEAEAQSQVLQYGVLGVVALVFAYVIVGLFKRGEAREARHEAANTKIAEERAAWATREVTLRAEYEAKHGAALEEYAQALQELREAAQTREDMIRREFSDLMEVVAGEAAKSSAAVTDVLHKFYDRILGPKAR